MAKSSKVNLWIFAVSLIALVWANNSSVPLWNADEAAYAGLAKTMCETGNGLIQDFPQADYHRKPPMHLWLMAISSWAFGFNEAAARLPSSLSILVGGLLIFFFMKKERSEFEAQVAAGAFISNYLILTLGKVAFVDAHLVLCAVAGGLALYRIVTAQHRLKHVILFWAAVAVGVLVKGPQILIFLGLLVALSFTMTSPLGLIKRLAPWFGLPLAALPFTVWAIMSYREDGGELLTWMLDWYILRRAEGEVVFDQWGPPGYYLGTFIAAFAPFLIGLVLSAKGYIKGGWLKDPFKKYLLLWLISGWLIYELIPSKLPTYAVSAYPALAMLIAIALKEVNMDAWKSLWMRLGIFFQLVITAVVSAALIFFVQGGYGYWGLFLAILAGLALVITSIIYVISLEGGKFERSGMILVWGNIIFGLFLVLPIMNMVKPQLDCPRQLGESLKLEVKKSDKILLAKEHIHMVNLPYYLSREGDLVTESDPTQAAYRANEEDFKVVVTDSILIEGLSAKYRVAETFDCLDMNANKTRSYVVMMRR
jgi:4-amino-4-deoxy-L-arabinose transferase-like glycosyltransferase